MVTARFFEWFQFGVLAGWGLLGLTRAILLRARGVPVFVVDRQRTPAQMLADAVVLICLLVWAGEVVAYAWEFDFHAGPAELRRVLVTRITFKGLGAGVDFVAVLLYASALRRLGESWRLGIDRKSPGPLVADGIYGWVRHPIYLAFDLLFVGTFLVHGRLVFLLLTLVLIPLLHHYMRREERFLTELYGDAYRDYCRCVGRYLPWPMRARKPNVG